MGMESVNASGERDTVWHKGVPFPPPKSPEKGARWLSSPGVSRDSGASFSGYTPDIVIGVAAATPLRYDPDDDPGKGSEPRG